MGARLPLSPLTSTGVGGVGEGVVAEEVKGQARGQRCWNHQGQAEEAVGEVKVRSPAAQHRHRPVQGRQVAAGELLPSS